MPHQFDTSSAILEGLEKDVLWLLILIYSFRRRSTLEGFGQLRREEIPVELVLLESAVRDIVSRLTALDDDTRNNRSFQTLFSAMKREGLDAARTKALGPRIKAFRAAVSELKVTHRNSYIAHVETLAEVTPRIVDNPVRFEGPASMAVNLLDEIKGSTIRYHFKAGGLSIDLREELNG